VNADALTEALSNAGNEVVSTAGARYKAIYLGGSSSSMTLAALRRLAALVEGGATVIGTKPLGSPSLAGDGAEYAALAGKLWPGAESAAVGKGRVVASSDINAALKLIGLAPDFSFTGGGADAEIPFVHRKLDDGDSYFLVNRKSRKEAIEARFRVSGMEPEIWRADTGTFESVSYRIADGETVVPLALKSEESLHVVFRKPATSSARTVAIPEPVTLATLDGAWAVRFQEGRGAPSSIVMPQLTALERSDDPGVRFFSGIATYDKRFDAPNGWKAGQPLKLNLGEVREVAEIRVNGTHAGYAWHQPYTVEIGHLVKPGQNQLEIRAANLWINRLIRDADPAVLQKVTWTPDPTYRADARLRPSGLIGPVTLEGSAR
jgi:hypothetical protein